MARGDQKTGAGAKGRKSDPKKAKKTKKAKKGGQGQHNPKRQQSAREGHAYKLKMSPALAEAFGVEGVGADGSFIAFYPNGGFVKDLNGPAEPGVPEGTRCNCLNRIEPSCKKHPSRIKVKTGGFIARPTKKDPNQRRAEWVLKAFVEAGLVKTVPFVRMKPGRKKRA